MLTGLLLGAVVGLVVGLTGASGGILAVPLLVFGTGASVAEAGPIGLVAVGMAAALSSVLGLRAGIVRYHAAVLIAAVGMLIAPAGLWMARQVNSGLLAVVFALALLYVVAKIYRQASRKGATISAIKAICVHSEDTGRFIWNRACSSRRA